MKKLSMSISMVAAGLVLSACGGSSGSSGGSTADRPYNIDIVRTQYGIPHIKTDNWGDAGYGLGYAYAQDNYCVLMKTVVRASGQSMRYLGDEGSLAEDVVYSYYNSDEIAQSEWLDPQPEYFQQLIAGYVAGVNRYYRDTGTAQLAEGDEGCRNAAWVREITELDIAKVLHKKILRASTDPLAAFIGSVDGPDSDVAMNTSAAKSALQPSAAELIAAIDPARVADALPMPKVTEMGSNAYAAGANDSRSDSAVLYGNPHFPWQGENRFYMFHLEVEGQYNVFGAALHGFPVANIGFNQDVAWTHTVSTGKRFTFYELTVNPENLMQYDYDGDWRDFERVEVTVERLDDNGAVISEQKPLYLSHYGPVVNLSVISEALGTWPNVLGTVIAVKDANLTNNRGMQQWTEMGQAGNMDEFTQSLARLGIPWVNTIAASRQGEAFYGDISVVPNVTQVQLDSCIDGYIAPLLTGEGYTTLNGSDSACEWNNDEGVAEGIFSYDSLPKLQNRGYVANANDSYWLSTAGERLEGFSQIVGREGIAQSLRTRQTFLQAEQRIDGSDGLGASGFDTVNMRELVWGNRNLGAELVLADLVASCQAVTDWSPYSTNTAEVDQACALLADWDGRFELLSVGPHIFTEFWRLARELETLWLNPFVLGDPINTPNTLNIAAAEAEILQAFAGGVDALVDARIAMDTAWGDVQFSERNGERIGIHGGSSGFMFNVISSDLVEGEGYSNIRHGNSYMQVVSWDQSDCPEAYVLLSYSQSTDPASAHYADMTKLYSQKQWIDAPYCDDDIEAASISTVTLEE